MSCGYENMSNPITYFYISQSEGDDSIDDILNFFFNYHPALAKDFRIIDL